MLLGFVSKCVRSTPFMGALALATFLTAGSARAQSADGKAAIAGSVQDPDAKAVVGAVVMSRNEQTGDMQTTTTDGRGHFNFAVQGRNLLARSRRPGIRARPSQRRADDG